MKILGKILNSSVRPKREKLVSAEYRIFGRISTLLSTLIYPQFFTTWWNSFFYISKPFILSFRIDVESKNRKLSREQPRFASGLTKMSSIWILKIHLHLIWRKTRQIEYRNLICIWFDGKLVKLNTETWFAFDLTEKMKKNYPLWKKISSNELFK